MEQVLNLETRLENVRIMHSIQSPKPGTWSLGAILEMHLHPHLQLVLILILFSKGWPAPLLLPPATVHLTRLPETRVANPKSPRIWSDKKRSMRIFSNRFQKTSEDRKSSCARCKRGDRLQYHQLQRQARQRLLLLHLHQDREICQMSEQCKGLASK